VMIVRLIIRLNIVRFVFEAKRLLSERLLK
jgi:hypothetical protein